MKGTKKEQKMLEKSSTSYLGAGCREFESRHSDQFCGSDRAKAARLMSCGF